MFYYNYHDQNITLKDAYTLIVMCAITYNKSNKNMDDIYNTIAILTNLDIGKMKRSMKIALRYSGSGFTKLDNYIVSLANIMSSLPKQLEEK